MTRLVSRFLAAAALAVPLFANASTVIQFNATLNGASEVPASGATATGIATLFYDTATSTYDFSLSAFGLTGGTIPGTAATSAHIHGPATTAQSAGVLQNILVLPFAFSNSGSTLLVGGDNVGHLSQPTFLAILQAGLAYVNIHTAAHPGGAIRGQLLQVTVVPEAETYAMMLAGLSLIGFVTMRRRRT